jgi:hypothetical protein
MNASRELGTLKLRGFLKNRPALLRCFCIVLGLNPEAAEIAASECPFRIALRIVPRCSRTNSAAWERFDSALRPARRSRTAARSVCVFTVIIQY